MLAALPPAGRARLALSLLPLLGACTCRDLAGPAARLEQAGRDLRALKALPLGPGLPELRIERLTTDRLLGEPDLHPPRLICSVDLDGSLALPTGKVAVGYLGVERIPMAERGGAFVPAGAALPALQGTLAALAARARASSDAELAALAAPDNPQLPRLAALAAGRQPDPPARWLIRAEVERVQVTEERASGRRLSSTLVPGAGGRYLFAGGLVPE